MFIAILFFAALNVVEALHDTQIIKIQKIDVSEKDLAKWHKLSALYYVILSVGACALTSFLYLPLALMSRRIFLDIPMNFFRKLPWDYYSDEGLDKFIKESLGKRAKYVELFVYLSTILFILIFK